MGVPRRVQHFIPGNPGYWRHLRMVRHVFRLDVPGSGFPDPFSWFEMGGQNVSLRRHSEKNQFYLTIIRYRSIIILSKNTKGFHL